MRILLLGVACLSLMGCALMGCSAGQSAGVGGASGLATAVSGTVSAGAPVAHALVTLKDAAGNSTTTTSAQNGTYSLNTTGLVPPFLIEVQAS